MDSKKRRLYGILLLLLIGSMLLFYFFNSAKHDKDLTEPVQLSVVEGESEFEYAVELEKVEETYKQMESFIRARVPISDDYLKFDLGDHSIPTVEEAQAELFNSLYTTLYQQNLDLMTVVFSGSSIQEVWGNEIDPEKRIAKLQESLEQLSRGGTFESLRYQLEKDKHGTYTDNGILYLTYQEGAEIEVPVKLAMIGNDDHRYYQLVTSIAELLQVIQS